jgi:hypothetical protein
MLGCAQVNIVLLLLFVIPAVGKALTVIVMVAVVAQTPAVGVKV